MKEKVVQSRLECVADSSYPMENRVATRFLRAHALQFGPCVRISHRSYEFVVRRKDRLCNVMAIMNALYTLSQYVQRRGIRTLPNVIREMFEVYIMSLSGNLDL